MKILLSAYACEPNKGSEPGVGWNWATRLAERCEVVVITRSNNRAAIEDAVKKKNLHNIKFYYFDVSGYILKLKNRIPGGVLLYYKLWQKKVLDFAKTVQEKEQCDIVHHITYNEFRTPGELYKLDIPYVWGPIGGGQMFNKVFCPAYFRKIDVVFEYIRNADTDFCGKYSKAIKEVEGRASAIVIADCSTYKLLKLDGVYRLFETAYDLNRNPIKPIYRKSGIIRLLWVGNIIPRKGLKLLIEALGESTYRNFKLDVIGGGKDKENCIELVAKYGLSDQICFHGKMDYNAVNAMYDNADLFLFTSLRDTSGNVVIEAMSHGLPTIAFNHHGVSEIVCNDCGVLVPIESYEQIKSSLVEEIIRFDENRNLIEEKGRKARKRIEDLFGWENNVSTMMGIYKNILGKGVK